MFTLKDQKHPAREYEITCVDEGIFHIRVSADGTYAQTLLSRYNILKEKQADTDAALSGSTVSQGNFSLTVEADGALRVTGTRKPLVFHFDGYEGKPYSNKGFTLQVDLQKDERLYGLGDESRKSISRRDSVSRLDIRNIASYGPIPYIMSMNGWGMLLNCTYASIFDMDKTHPDQVNITAHKGMVDFYLFLPASGTLKDILALHGKIAGNPVMLPKFAYGYTFVLNEQTNAREMLYDCLNFRREDISCDMVGLEPQWMSRHYDTSVDKKFDEDRFYIPGWLPENQSGPETFFYSLRQMGFRLSLWLCQNYDLLFEEERQCGERMKKEGKEYTFEGASILDEHLACPMYMDGLTVRDQPWFEHLKKFCDNGAEAFKLDGAFQVNDHPDRLWGGKYFDDEVHNVYPVLYVKQMQEGFADYTGRRAMIYTPCVYAGTQQYAASWAGDTGGGFDTVVAMLNYGLSGHSNVTCDMHITSLEGIHYGFLSPWTQQLGWRTWNLPWFMRQEVLEAVRYYSHLRSELFPYIYSMAHLAAKTSMPLARALPLMYPDNPDYDQVANTYMFGDSLLVAVFDMNVTLPQGQWIDFFTGDIYEGGQVIQYKIPKGRGGALMVKAGSVFCTMPYQKYLHERVPEAYAIQVYPGGDASFTLCEDDGYTYDYREGKMATTVIAMENSSENGFDLVISPREGSFAGREKNESSKPSDPAIPGMGEVTEFQVRIFGGADEVTLDGKAIPARRENGFCVFDVPKELHAAGQLVYHIAR